MVCSKGDSSDQISIMDGDSGDKTDQNASRSRAIDILTPEGETLKISVGENAMIKDIKIDCELLCGIPSDLQLIKLQGKDLCNEDTVASLGITDGCTLRLTVPQWWQKFVSTCFKGDTQQVRKRIYVKMSQVSREERSFTAAFIGAVKGNHNLMFAAFAGGKMNLHSKTKLSGRNLLHAAVSGGSTSCVANILMNEGNALLEAPDNTGETPVKMAIKLYGEDGDIVKFLNVYLELHRRDAKHSGFSNHYWDNLERNNINISDAVSGDNDSNNGDESHSQSDESISNKFGDLDLDSDETPGEKIGTTYTETDFFTPHNSRKNLPSVTKVNVEDYDATTGQDSLAVSLDSSSKLDDPEINANHNSLSSNEQGCGQKSDTGYYSGNNQSTEKDANHVTEMLWNESLFTQGKTSPIDTTTNQPSNLAADEPENVTHNASILSADPSADGDADSSFSPKPPRRAQLRKQSILDSRRKKSTTERPNLELLLAMSSQNSSPLQGHSNEGIVSEPRDSEVLTNESRDNEESHEAFTNESREKQDSATNVENQKEQITLPTASPSSSCGPDTPSQSPKPLRRAQLRKKSIVEQRRRRSIAARPNLEELTANREEEAEEATSAETRLESSALEPKEQGTTAVESKEEGASAPETKEKGSSALESKEKGSSAVESKGAESTAVDLKEEESPISARYVLQLWQDQAQETAAAALSGDESDASHSPKIPRRAFLRKQVFMEQRRRRSATERPNIIKLIAAAKEQGDGEEGGEETAEITSQDKGEEPPVESQNDECAISVGQESICYDFSPVTSSDEVSMREHYSEDKETPETSSHSPAVVQIQQRAPIRTSQRCSNSGPLLEARARRDQRRNRSSLSGEESDVSDNEQSVLQETVAPINRVAKTQRRRRLPVLPDKIIKLPVIKIEDSGSSVSSDSRDAHVSNQVCTSGPVNGEMRSAAIAPHPPACRSRSGSICSEDSMSSGEVYSERPRALSQEENRYSPQTAPHAAKSVPVRQRRKSVPNNTFRPTPNPPITRTRRGSVQVEDLEEQGYQISPQLRARLKLRGQPRENLPWNEWRTKRRSGSVPDGSEGETEAENINPRELSNKDARVDTRVAAHVDTRVAWHEKGPQSPGNSRMTFTEWLDSKEALERTRPASAHAVRNKQQREGVGHERHLHNAKKYEEWLRKKDQEALEQEEMLRKNAIKKFHRTYKKK